MKLLGDIIVPVLCLVALVGWMIAYQESYKLRTLPKPPAISDFQVECLKHGGCVFMSDLPKGIFDSK